jgi:ABC-2 type transport system permease protein
MLWGALGTAFVLASAWGYAAAYPSPESRAAAAAALSSTTSFQFLLGPPHELASTAGFTAWRAGGALAIIYAVWGLFLATSLLRGEEEQGRTEVEASGRTTLQGVTRASLEASLVGWVTLTLWLSLSCLVLVSDPSLKISASAALGAGLIMAASGLFFLGVGALTSQLGLSRRSANMMGAAVIGLSVLLRGLAAVIHSWGWLVYLSPLGWVDRAWALTANRLVELIPVLVLGLALVVAAVVVAGHRDLASALWKPRRDHRHRFRRFTGVLWSTLSLGGGVDLAWIGAFAWMGVVYGLSAKSASRLTSSSGIQKVLIHLGVIKVGPEAYLGIAGFTLALFGLIVAAVAATATAKEELDGRAEILLAGTLSRTRWLLGRAGAGLGVLVVACAASSITMYLSVLVTGAHVGSSMLLSTTLAMAAPGAALLGLSTLAQGIAPSFGRIVAYGLIVWSFLVTMVVAVIKLNHFVADLTLLGHSGYPPGSTFKLLGVSSLGLIALFAAVLGSVLFARRDLTPSG